MQGEAPCRPKVDVRSQEMPGRLLAQIRLISLHRNACKVFMGHICRDSAGLVWKAQHLMWRPMSEDFLLTLHMQGGSLHCKNGRLPQKRQNCMQGHMDINSTNCTGIPAYYLWTTFTNGCRCACVLPMLWVTICEHVHLHVPHMSHVS